jgi:uncharacterized cysteine cluster protein YcgN (CxxCxxCC family)
MVFLTMDWEELFNICSLCCLAKVMANRLMLDFTMQAGGERFQFER